MCTERFLGGTTTPHHPPVPGVPRPETTGPNTTDPSPEGKESQDTHGNTRYPRSETVLRLETMTWRPYSVTLEKGTVNRTQTPSKKDQETGSQSNRVLCGSKGGTSSLYIWNVLTQGPPTLGSSPSERFGFLIGPLVRVGTWEDIPGGVGPVPVLPLST